MSATAQPWALRLSGRMTVFSCVLSFSLLSPPLCISPPLSLSLFLPSSIYLYSIPFTLFLFSPSPFTFICVTLHISLFLLHKAVCPHFYADFQMPLHAKWSLKVASKFNCISKHGTVMILEGVSGLREYIVGNYCDISWHIKWSFQIIWPMFKYS